MAEWRKIDGYDYSVSDDGQVRNDKTGIIKQNTENSHGYDKVDLYKDSKRTTVGVHRLVAKAFIENPDNKPHVNHKDGNKRNNKPENLEWVTAKENVQHAEQNGLTNHVPTYGMLGKKNPNGGVKGNPVMLVETGEIFKSAADAERKTGVSDTSILDCIHGRTNTTKIGRFVYPK